MSTDVLRHQLIASLRSIYDLEAFGALADLLQGESLALTFLLEHRGQEVFPSDLSRELHLSRSRITGALTSLARKGLVSTHHSQADRRRVQVSITDQGAEQIADKLERMEAYFDKMLDGLGEDDARTLIALIHRCVEVMGQ